MLCERVGGPVLGVGLLLLNAIYVQLAMMLIYCLPRRLDDALYECLP